MARRPFLTALTVQNFLSIRMLERLTLGDLNVLVGPNAAGKTNLLKVFRFLGEVARVELLAAIERVGGVDRILYQGAGEAGREISIGLEGRITAHASAAAPDEYTLTFYQGRLPRGRRYISRKEVVNFKRVKGRGRRITVQGDDFEVYTVDGENGHAQDASSLKLQKTATALGTVRRLGKEYEAPSLKELAELLETLRLVDIDVERARRASHVDEGGALESDARNLSAFLLSLSDRDEEAFAAVADDLRFVLPGFERFQFTGSAEDDEVEIQIKERHLERPTSLFAASFGTVRAIALFAMLNDPDPPPLTCIEEIDTGLHPHALDRVVDRLRDAATRSQIIVATHSPALVNRLQAEELIVVERDESTGESRFTRPDPNRVEFLRTKLGYELGELWFSGAIGGDL